MIQFVEHLNTDSFSLKILEFFLILFFTGYEVYLNILATKSSCHENGIKKMSLEQIAENQIVMDLRVTVDETTYPAKANKYITPTVSVGKDESEGK